MKHPTTQKEETMFHYVYLIRSKSTDKYYIGVRSSRKEPNQDPYMGSGKVIKALLKANPADWDKYIISEHIDRDEALVAEKEATEGHYGQPWCLNMRRGGNAYFNQAYVASPSTRKKMSESAKRDRALNPRKRSTEAIEKTASKNRGRTNKPESIQLMKDVKVGWSEKYGDVISQRTKEAMANMTVEEKQAMSAAQVAAMKNRPDIEKQKSLTKLRNTWANKTPEEIKTMMDKRAATKARNKLIKLNEAHR